MTPNLPADRPLPAPAATDTNRAFLRGQLRKPQRHRLLHGYPLAGALSPRRPGLPADVRPDPGRGLLVGVLPHPFCNPAVRGCGFCTFPHQQLDTGRSAAVVERVSVEIRTRLAAQPELAGRRVDALYFGGGTANLSPVEPFRRLCRTLADSFDLRGAEVTLEGVPAYFVKRKPLLVDVLREELPARHFRVSMGVQTFDPDRLRRMGRQGFGDSATFLAVVEAAHERGFTASADLLFNLPHQTPVEMRRDVGRADALGLDHLGLYHLVLFRGLGTEWARDADMLAGRPDNPTAARNWFDLRDRLLGSGWVQTTLTNFERRAYRGDPRRFVYEEFSFRPDRYDALGFGPGGISFASSADLFDGLKVVNPDGAEAYVAAVDRGGAPWDRYFVYGMLDMEVFYVTRRLAVLGIGRAEYQGLFVNDLLEDFGGEVAAEAGLVDVSPDAVRLTPVGMFYADSAAALFARRTREDRRRGSGGWSASPTKFDNGYGHM
jgi:oxygen-independent coproporphyrinogen-3 oxidase